MSRVFIGHLDSTHRLHDTLSAAMAWVRADAIISSGARVFIKPNLTWKYPTPGVTVTPAFLRALVEILLPITPNLVIGESEGGQSCFQAEEAFQNHGVYDLEREYGLTVVNLSKVRHETVHSTVNGSPISVELPCLLLHEVDVFISVPVPKVHAMTVVSIGFKNQWGCLGDKMRVTQHPQFGPAILAINKVLKPRLCICDGTYFLDHTGPMMGEAVPMNLVIAGDDVGATSFVCCKLMKIDTQRVRHYRLARKEGMFPTSEDQIELNRPVGEFAQRQFRLKRSVLNYLHLAAFNNLFLNRFFYDSIFADVAHQILWFVRRNPLVRRLLYGKYVNLEVNRGGDTT